MRTLKIDRKIIYRYISDPNCKTSHECGTQEKKKNPTIHIYAKQILKISKDKLRLAENNRKIQEDEKMIESPGTGDEQLNIQENKVTPFYICWITVLTDLKNCDL